MNLNEAIEFKVKIGKEFNIEDTSFRTCIAPSKESDFDSFFKSIDFDSEISDSIAQSFSTDNQYRVCGFGYISEQEVIKNFFSIDEKVE